MKAPFRELAERLATPEGLRQARLLARRLARLAAWRSRARSPLARGLSAISEELYMFV